MVGSTPKEIKSELIRMGFREEQALVAIWGNGGYDYPSMARIMLENEKLIVPRESLTLGVDKISLFYFFKNFSNHMSWKLRTVYQVHFSDDLEDWHNPAWDVTATRALWSVAVESTQGLYEELAAGDEEERVASSPL